MLELINATVIFAFGLFITGIVFLGVIQARDQATGAVKIECNTFNKDIRSASKT